MTAIPKFFSASKHADLIKAMLETLPKSDMPITHAVAGSHMVAVQAGRMGVASRTEGHGIALGGEQVSCTSALEMASWLAKGEGATPLERSFSMAAYNALVSPPSHIYDIKGQNLILEHGKGKNVAVVGHFPFVSRMGEQFSSFSVLELSPRAGDEPAQKAVEIIPQADVVAITGTTLMNGTLGGLLDLCREDAFVIVLGPSTPACPALFEFGVDVLAGATVSDPDVVGSGVVQGFSFKKLDGLQPFVIKK